MKNVTISNCAHFLSLHYLWQVPVAVNDDSAWWSSFSVRQMQEFNTVMYYNVVNIIKVLSIIRMYR